LPLRATTARCAGDVTVKAAADSASAADDAVVATGSGPVADDPEPTTVSTDPVRTAVSGAGDAGDDSATGPPAAAEAWGAADADDTDAAGTAAATGAAAAPGAAGAGAAGGCVPAVAVAGGAGAGEAAGADAVTGECDAGADGRGAARGGSSPSGSTYPSACEATRTPRWTVATECSASPLEPIVATAAPSSTISPFATSTDPRCTSVTAYPSAVRIVRLRPYVGSEPAKLTVPDAGARMDDSSGPAMSMPRCCPAA
jgi:hypothetical protein